MQIGIISTRNIRSLPAHRKTSKLSKTSGRVKCLKHPRAETGLTLNSIPVHLTEIMQITYDNRDS